MFTGIVAELGEVRALRRVAGGAVLDLVSRVAGADAEPGESIAVSGACLTVTSIGSGGALSFDLSEETLGSTTLGDLRPGERVNLESALRAGAKLGGHFVTGHVDAVGRILSKRPEGHVLHFEVEAPPAVLEYLVPKGSVAVDGISLTVVEVRAASFTLVIIPHTASLTTLGFKGPGARVNLESDMLGKYVRKFLVPGGGRASSLDAALRTHGFM